MDIYECNRLPFTYLIMWSSTGMKYYGVRVAKNCNPSDLWTIYFTSSKFVKDYRMLHGDPDIIQIRKIFRGSNSVDLALSWEKKVLNRIQAKQRQDYLNKSNGWNTTLVPPGWNKGYTKHTSEKVAKAAIKISKKLKGRNSANDAGRLSATKKLTGRTKATHEHVANTAAKLTGRTKHNDAGRLVTSQKVSQTMRGRTKDTHPHLKALSEKYQRTYEITQPNGSVIIIKDIKQWCKENGLNLNTVRSAYRKGSRCKGYLIRNLGLI